MVAVLHGFGGIKPRFLHQEAGVLLTEPSPKPHKFKLGKLSAIWGPVGESLFPADFASLGNAVILDWFGCLACRESDSLLTPPSIPHPISRLRRSGPSDLYKDLETLE